MKTIHRLVKELDSDQYVVRARASAELEKIGPPAKSVLEQVFADPREQSGAFVDHAAAIEYHILPGSVMIPNNDYIYRYIVPGAPTAGIYGDKDYYGNKIFYKSSANDMYVLTIPTGAYPAAPQPSDFPNLNIILHLVSQLRCHMYDNALIPIALANKLVSLSDFPSQRILTEFARGEIT